jgi:DNA-binding transcriptional ArsR family regulator
MLARLRAGAASASELGQPFRLSQPAISKHLKVLESAGLISRGREAQWRPCQLVPRHLAAAAGWFEPYRPLWSPPARRSRASPKSRARVLRR